MRLDSMHPDIANATVYTVVKTIAKNRGTVLRWRRELRRLFWVVPYGWTGHTQLQEN